MTPLLRTLFALLAIVSLSSPPAYAQPGNALHFRGNITDRDYASVTNTGNVLDISGALTMEAWIRPELKTGADEANKWSTIIMKGNYGYGMVIGGDNCQPSSVGRLGYWGQVSCGSVPYSTATVNFGRWNHVAVTISSNTATFYVNGIKSGTATVSAIPDGGSGSALYLGIQGTGSGNGFFKGDMDELRIWNVARTEAQIQAGMYNEVSASSPGLVAYYHFDQGIAGGNNAAVTTVTDAGPSHLDATLHNFLLSGSTSNWIESYAIVLPKLQDASGVSSSGFTAGWTAPQVGTWDTYLLDVATDKAFTQMVSGYNGLDAGNTTSYSVTGLSGASAYYWRVRADKTSVTGKGAYSSPYGSVTIPVAGKGKALTLESANSEGVQVTNNSYLDWGTSSFTVEAWIKRGSNSGHHTIAGRQTLSATGWYFRISNNKLSFATGQGGSYNYVDSDGSTDISDNNWHHVAAVLDASGKTLTLYIDGKPDKTQAFQLSTALNINTASDLGIGFKPYYGEYFNGSVDEVRLWTTARTQQQLQEFMNTPLKGTETGLLGYWNFEDGSGVYDICTNKSGSFSSTLLTADHDEWADGNIGYTAVTGFNAPLNLRLGGSDIAGQALPRAVIYSLPSHGRLFQTSDGVTKGDEITATSVQVTDAGGNPARVIYQPNTSYSGPDAFQYQVSSGTTFSGNTETVDITVGPNHAPTGISLSATVIAENSAAGATVGTLSTTDTDVPETFSYTFVTGGADNAAFTITGSTLSIHDSPDFETKNSYSLRIRTTDQGGAFFDKDFTITITDINEAPSDIALSATSINENITAGSTVGTLSTTDPDAANTFTYTFAGGADDAAFTITGNTLSINATPDFESKSSYTVKVRSADQGTLSFEKTFTITINNVNETPADIILSATSINENITAGSTVGTLSTTDPDAANTFTYSFAGGADDAAFTITGNTLSIHASPDFESKNSYTIKVRSADQAGLFFEKTFVITINDMDEIAPGVDATGIPADGYYTSGTQLDFTLHFTENVFVNTTGGIPSLTVMIGSRQVAAMYISGSGSNTLLFRYTVHDNDEDMDGISTGALVLNGATIQDNMNNNAIVSLNDTTLSHVKVDAVPPSVISLERTEGSDTVSNKTLLVYRLRFSEEVTGVDVNDFLLAATGTVTAHIANVSSSGAGEWNITADNIRGDGRLQLILPGTGTAITDLAGNNMTMSLTGEAVTIDHTPPQTPVINSVNEDTGNKDTYITHTPVLTIAGKAEAGSLITVTSAATSLSFTTVTTREGDWSVSTGMSFAEGEYPIRVVSADAAGNNSIPAQLLAAIDTTMPFVQRISITEALPADYPALIRYTVYFSEPVHGLSANNFTLLSPGITGAAITDIQTSGTSAVLTVDPGTGSGSIRLDIVNSLSVKDAAGNPLKGLPVEGERYIINRPPAFAKGAAAMLLLCENATGVSIDSLLAAADTDKEQPITWSVTKAPMHGSVGGFPFSMVSAGEIMRPSGYTYIPFRGYHGKDSFSIKLSDGMAETVMTVFVTVRPLPVMPALFNISQSEVCPAQQNIAYSVEADDSLQYLWKYTGTGVTIHDSNSNLIHLSFTDSATSGTLSVTSGARNGCGLPATIAMQVMVNRPVAVTADPRNQAACEGQRMIFIVNAAGTGLHYQWQVKKENGFENITDTGMYTGYQSDTLVIPAAKALMDGYIFRCLVSGTCSATASGMATLSVSTPATILLQPADTSICYGTDALFTILATGVHNRYTWQVNDGNGFSSLADNNLYSGSTSDKLTIHAPGKSFYGYRYRVLVTNSCHTLTPGEATLTFASSWTGTADSDWDNPANWSCNTVPDKHTDVVINASAPRMPVISSAAMVNNLLIGAGAAVDLAQGSSLQTYGNVSGNGSFNAGKGLVVFAGTGPQNIPAGTYDSLQLDGGGMKALNGNVTVNGALLLSKGKLVLGNHNLQLSAKAGMQHYDSSSFIVTNGNGTVLFTQVGTAGVVFPVGANTGSYTPVTIINASGKPEDFEVKVIDHIYHNYKVYAPYNGTIGNSYVDKTWFIRKASAGASNITVRFQWNAADELPGFDRTMAAVSHYLEPDSSWMLYTAQGAAGTGPFTVQQEGIGAFSPFSISSTAPGLPEPQFQWLSSIVSASGQAVLLQWTTHNEKGGAFRVERSSDGFSFSPAFTITKTTGGIASTGSYSIRDVQVHPGYRYYYRIVYTDNSGKTYTSPILQLALNGEARNHLVILGNPFRNRLQYRVTAQSAGRVAVYLTDIAGHRLLQKEEQVLKGENLFLLTGSERLASGTYLFNMVIDGELMEKRIIKAR